MGFTPLKERIKAEFYYNRLLKIESEKEELLARIRFINKEIKRLSRVRD